jgi:microcystin degradation protein MlrC
VGRLLAHGAFASGQLTAIYASIPDAAAVAACYAAGIGQGVEVTLGGKLDPVHAQPLPVQGTVAGLYPDDPVGGDIAVLRAGGVSIILTSRRKPHHHLKDFTALGLDPDAHKLTVVKIGYLEPELRQMARHALLALTPGAVNQDIPALTYRRVQRPIFPLDQDFEAPDLAARLFGGE